MSSTGNAPWSETTDSVMARLGVTASAGLSDDAVQSLRGTWGENALRRTERRGAWAILWDQLRTFIALLLVVGAVLSFAFGHVAEGVAIFAVIAINAAIGFVTELRAVRSMEALRALGNVEATVRRNGVVRRVPAQELVPGDMVLVEGGDVVTADLRLVSASRCQANESALTGESVPEEKSPAPLAEDTLLADRVNMLYKGTAVTRGAAEGVVVATGMHTELGKISALVEQADAKDTPLEKRLDKLGQALAWASLGFVAVVGVVGVVSGKSVFLVVQTAIALAVATVPEGLPIVATLALARGMWRMARRNALIEELPAVETLGSTTVILTDKTGTLTENQMTVVRVALADSDVTVSGTGLSPEGHYERDGGLVEAAADPLLKGLLSAAALCTDASWDPQEETAVGDPMEVALLVAAGKAGFSQGELGAAFPRVREEAFDPDIRMMATVHESSGSYLVAVKGAPEAVIEKSALSDHEKAGWREKVELLGQDGLRVLAIADKSTERVDEDPYSGLCLRGLVGLLDPPRASVREAVATCQKAGVRVVMVTGDHAGTALHVGRAVGLAASDDIALQGRDIPHPDQVSWEDARRLTKNAVFARTSPEQKQHLLSLYQRSGDVVAMIGDGVNDAPALRQADIGVAMGQRGTQVAREAAAMVLTDDEFASVPVAIAEGRVIFGNIRNFVVYLVSCNLSEILTVGLASLVGAPLPILPLQILFLNLITDVFPALALGVSEGDEHVMERAPRPRTERFLARGQWRKIIGYGLLLASCVLGGMAVARLVAGMSVERSVTVSFLILAFSQLVHVFNMTDPGAPVWRNVVSRNRWVWWAIVLCAGLIGAGVYVPALASVLQLQSPGVAGWAIVATFSLVPFLVGLMLRYLDRGRWAQGGGTSSSPEGRRGR